MKREEWIPWFKKGVIYMMAGGDAHKRTIGQGQQQQNATVGDSLADLVADEEAGLKEKGLLTKRGFNELDKRRAEGLL